MQARSAGLTVGNGGLGVCDTMSGCHAHDVKAIGEGIEEARRVVQWPGVKAVFLGAPLATAGYAAFLMAHE